MLKTWLSWNPLGHKKVSSYEVKVKWISECRSSRPPLQLPGYYINPGHILLNWLLWALLGLLLPSKKQTESTIPPDLQGNKNQEFGTTAPPTLPTLSSLYFSKCQHQPFQSCSVLSQNNNKRHAPAKHAKIHDKVFKNLNKKDDILKKRPTPPLHILVSNSLHFNKNGSEYIWK